jgi:hypothetical protein
VDDQVLGLHTHFSGRFSSPNGYQIILWSTVICFQFELIQWAYLSIIKPEFFSLSSLGNKEFTWEKNTGTTIPIDTGVWTNAMQLACALCHGSDLISNVPLLIYNELLLSLLKPSSLRAIPDTCSLVDPWSRVPSVLWPSLMLQMAWPCPTIPIQICGSHTGVHHMLTFHLLSLCSLNSPPSSLLFKNNIWWVSLCHLYS